MNDRKFIKYFFNTLKEGKYLLIEIVVIAILSTTISVLSNLLKISELTYFNSFLSLSFFSAMISFGISQSTNILVNQSINNQKKVDKYVKMGFEITVLLAIVFTSIMLAFPSFFMETIMEYVPSDYKFYYLMCIYFFINCMAQYIEDVLKKLEIFKGTFLSTSLHLIIIIIGLVFLYFTNLYFLNYIAIVYIISVSVLFSLYLYLLHKKSGFSINLFKLTALSFTKKQFVILISNFFTEIIWEIGYYATSVFLIRSNTSLFNTYSYLESVLDIFNSIYFAYIMITSIKIAQSLGQNNFEQAKQHAKYSLIGVLILWLAYAMLSLTLIYPLALGVKKEYFDIMFFITPCYVVLHLFRFLNWNFSSYMLRLGGKENLSLMTITILTTLYQIIICFLTSYLPSSIIFTYFVILFPELITLPINFIIYKRGKWINNINNDPNLLTNKIRCFIFNFDNTLYYDINWKKLYILQKKFIKEQLKNFDTKKLEQDIKILFKRKDYEKIQNKILQFTKINCKQSKCLNMKNIYFNSINKLLKTVNVISAKEIEKFKAQSIKMKGQLILISNQPLKEIKKKAKNYNIDLTLFDKIECVNCYPREKIYKKIITETSFKPNEILLIGSNYNYEIKPAKKLKFYTFLSKNGFSYEEVIS